MRTVKILGALGFLACIVAVTGCPGTGGGSQNRNGGPTTNGNGATDPTMRVIAGLEFWSINGCGACHCNNAQGGCNLDAPPLLSVDQLSVNSNLRDPQNESAHPLKLTDASDDDIRNVTEFLGSLDERSRLAGDSAITRGYNLYISGGCVACHLTSAQGSTQGGIGLPIQGTEVDNIYFALSGGTACHPLQFPVPTVEPRAACPSNLTDPSLPGMFSSNATVESLVDTPAPEIDDQRTLLSYFLSFIAPPPSGGVVEPCEDVRGEICTIAGNGISGYTEDGIPATQALLYNPLDLELTDWNADGTLDLGIVDWNNHRIRVVYLDTDTENADREMVANQIISIAGTGKVTGDDALNHATDLAFDANGALVMANWHNQNMYRYARGLVNGADRDQIAGLCDLRCGGNDTSVNRVGDTFLSLPDSVAIHPDGRIFVSEAGCSRLRILTVAGERIRSQPVNCIGEINFFPDGTLVTLAGRSGMNGYMGDDGPASGAIFNIDNSPLVPNMGIALSRENPPNELYVADSRNHCIRVIDLSADPPTIRLFAGTPTMSGFVDGAAIGEALFNRPSNVQVDDNDIVYVADAFNHAIRTIDQDGRVRTIAGTGTLGFNGDNQPAAAAQLNYPNGVAIHPDGRIFIADTNNNRVRVINP